MQVLMLRTYIYVYINSFVQSRLFLYIHYSLYIIRFKKNRFYILNQKKRTSSQKELPKAIKETQLLANVNMSLLFEYNK